MALPPQPGAEARARWKKIQVAVAVSDKIGRRLVPRENRFGNTLRGTGMQEEHLALALQMGITKLGGSESTNFAERLGDRRVDFELHGSRCHIEEFGGKGFLEVRTAFGLEEMEYRAVLGAVERKGTETETTDMRLIGTGSAAGRSPAWFLVSKEMRYVLKTCNEGEANVMLTALPDYARYIEAHAERTLLPRYYGLYLLRVEGFPQVLFFVMANVFAGYIPIMERYDLKGSTSGRKASMKERAKGPGAVLKDVDLLQRGRPFVLADNAVGEDDMTKTKTKDQLLQQDDRGSLIEALDADCAWLSEHGFIDYSLLVGLAHRPSHDKKPVSRHVVRAINLITSSEDEHNLVYCGIIDILTKYTCRKVAETRALTPISGNISCKPPLEYAERFKAFMRHIFVGPNGPADSIISDRLNFERQWLRCAMSGMLRRAFARGNPHWAELVTADPGRHPRSLATSSEVCAGASRAELELTPLNSMTEDADLVGFGLLAVGTPRSDAEPLPTHAGDGSG